MNYEKFLAQGLTRNSSTRLTAIIKTIIITDYALILSCKADRMILLLMMKYCEAQWGQELAHSHQAGNQANGFQACLMRRFQL